MFRYDRLDELIAETGKKKTFLSIRMGHAGRYLNDVRKQNTNIKTEEVEILANELGTTVEYLTGESDIKKAPAEISERGISRELGNLILDKFCELSEDKQKALLVMLDIE